MSEHNYVTEDERWEYLVTSMILGDAFVHEFIIMMSKYADERIKTMGVRVINAAIQLCYAPTFLAKLTDSEARWVLVHEILHLVFHHCTVRNSTDKRLHDLDNIAADLAINQLIPETGHIMRPRPEVITPYFPEALSFPKLLSKEQYFQLLIQKEDENNKSGGGKGKLDKNKGKGKSNKGDGKDDPSNGGNGEGNEIDEAGDLVDNHDGWSEAEAEIIDEIIRNKVDQMSRSSKTWGKVTGGIKEMILAAQRSQIAWWRLLREYLGLFSTTKKESTLKRPNRRYGYPFPGIKRKHIDKILCAVDSSGSISEDSLKRFLTEMNTIQETHPVDLVVFDDGITQGPMPFTRKRKTFEFKGRGGTNFSKVMELASKDKYKCLVILTDGCAAACDYPKGVVDVIWCLVDDGKPPVEWGKKVHIKDKPGAERAA
jgi:predicted metal-dependent peptidase